MVCMCVCVCKWSEGRMMTEWPSHVPVVIFHRGQPLRMHGMQRPHVSLFLVSPFLSLILSLYLYLPFCSFTLFSFCLLSVSLPQILSFSTSTKFAIRKFKKYGYFRRFPLRISFWTCCIFSNSHADYHPTTPEPEKSPDNFCRLCAHAHIANAA